MGLYTDQQLLNTSPENAQLQRQRKLAEALTAQGLQAQPQGQMISGHYVAPSWTQQLAPVITGGIGAYVGNQLDKKEEKIAELLRGKKTEVQQSIMEKVNQGDLKGALAIASQNSEYGGKEFVTPLMAGVIPKAPEATTLEREFKAAQSDPVNPYKGSITDFKNQMSEYQRTQAADAKARLGIDYQRLNLEKSKREINPAESGLRTSFLNQAQPHIAISQAYRKIDSAPTTAAGDMSRIFGYMKILDPGSTVREGEYASAENARGVPDTVRAQYNRVMSGQRLTDKQRNEFTQAAGDLVSSQKQQFNEVVKYYTDISTRNQVNPENIIYDPYKDITLKTTPPKEPKAAVNANKQLNIPSSNGWNVLSVTPSK
jgi:hypothetical protein